MIDVFFSTVQTGMPPSHGWLAVQHRVHACEHLPRLGGRACCSQPASSRRAVVARMQSLRAPEPAKPSGDVERARDLRIPCVFQRHAAPLGSARESSSWLREGARNAMESLSQDRWRRRHGARQNSRAAGCHPGGRPAETEKSRPAAGHEPRRALAHTFII
jgi:hypothetical protein